VLAISIFFFISSPTAAQTLTKAAYHSGILPGNLSDADEYADDMEKEP
jgi:multisubunit Na+/H+ antiporter MnhG subunit